MHRRIEGVAESVGKFWLDAESVCKPERVGQLKRNVGICDAGEACAGRAERLGDGIRSECLLAAKLQRACHLASGVAARTGLESPEERRHTPRREDEVAICLGINRSLPVRIGRKVGLPPLGARGWLPRKGKRREGKNKKRNNKVFHIWGIL